MGRPVKWIPAPFFAFGGMAFGQGVGNAAFSQGTGETRLSLRLGSVASDGGGK
ncbi:MAG: hypothetical protein ACLRSW_14595 [Christensenellaceae bacterium]